MNQLFRLFFLSFVLVTFNGCDKDKETVPSYLHIKKFKLTTTTAVQGLNTADIVSAKVFADGIEVGTFELPATIPILATGDVEITLLPNIKENGNSNYHVNYKPYNSDVQIINLQKLRVDTIQPKTTYRSLTTFAWMEDFDDQAIALEKYGLNNTNDSLVWISTSTPGVNQPFTGSVNCGLIDIATGISTVDFERATFGANNGWYYLPNMGTDVYVEMDFKSNVNIQVGVFKDEGGLITRVPVLFTYPTEQWKKIYINLKSEIGDLPSSTKIKVFFGVYRTPTDMEMHPIVYLDNLKLVYVN